MARTAQIGGNNTVVNIIEAPNGFTLSGFVLVQSATANTGDTYHPGDGSFTANPVPVDHSAELNAIAKSSFIAGLQGKANTLIRQGKTAEAMKLLLKAQDLTHG